MVELFIALTRGMGEPTYRLLLSLVAMSVDLFCTSCSVECIVV